ncbi:MAG TPA: translocation/assembly module TamB domain-containing protein [Terriglobales bacterium]|nr:translocation/assembly module TamB domain-containing protein [Terriglobales bacterium]
MAAPNLPPYYNDQPQERTPPEQPAHHSRWKKIVAWTAGIIALLIIAAIVTVYVLLHNQSFHQYVLKKAEQKAAAALGVQLQAKDFQLHFNGISPSLDLYDVVIHGAEPYPNPPLLTIDHLHAGVKVTSILSRTWYLEDVTIDHPVARLFVDAHGVDNLPQTKSNKQQSNTSVFDLGVRHALLDNGEIYYNNRKSVMDADLHDLTFRSTFDTSQKRYSGNLSYKNGHLKFENFNPVPHDLSASFDATPQAFTLKDATLRSGNSQFVLNATLTDYMHPHIQATYTAALDAGQLRRTLKNASLPVGVLHARGSLSYQSEPNTPMIALVNLNGDLNSNSLEVITPSLHTTIRDLGARYTVAHGNLDVTDMHAALLGGELTGTLTMRDLTGASQSHLKATLRGVSVADVKSVMNSPALKKVALTGTMNADADATWGRTFANMLAKANARLHAAVAPSAGNAAPVPLDGVIHAGYSQRTKEITLANSYLRLPQTSLNLNGTVSNRSSLRVNLQSSNLHELETIADEFRGPGAQPFGLYGTAAFNGTVSGTTAAPHLVGQFTANNLRVHGTTWRLLRTDVNASPSGASLANGELDPATKGRVTFNVSAGLHHWAFSDTSPIQVAFNANQLNVGELSQAAGVQTPIQGTLSANIALHGSELNPIGQGNLSLTNAKVSSEPINSLTAKFSGTGEVVNADLAARLPAGAATANLVYYPKTQAYDAQLQVPGLKLGQLETVKARNLNLTGVLTLVASGKGTIKNPQLTAQARIPKLVIDNQAINGIALNANVANHVGSYNLNSQVLNTSIRSQGTVNMTGDYYANATLDTQAIPLGTIVAAYAPSQAGNITGQTELHATVHGPLKDKALLQAHVVIPTLNVDYKNTVQLGAVSPIHIDFVNDVLTLQRTQLRGTDTDLQFQATVPMNKNAPASLLALGTVNLKIVQLFDPSLVTSGELKLNVNSYGQRTNPNVEGQIQVVNAGFASGDLPLGLQNGNGVLTLTKDRLDITSFTGKVGGGQVTAKGGVVYRPSLSFDMAVAGKGIRLLYPDGVRTGLGMNLALTGTPQAAQLGGDIHIYQLSFTPDFDMMNFIGQFSGDTVPPPSQGFTQNLALNLNVAATNGISLVSRTLSLDGTANLQVRGTAAQPVILGRVNLNSGDLIFNGNRYVLESATINFVNPYETQPVVNASVNTTIQDYNIMMHFDGPVDRLHTNYASNPALPPADIINLLAFGKTTEASAANPTPPGSLGAESLIASQVTSQVTSRLEKVAGISQLSIDPELGQNNTNPGARVTIQQRVTSNLFVTFATDVTQTQNTVIKLEYHINPRVSVSGTRDQNGGFGFLTRIHKSW